jgi:elongation factor Ts
MEITAGMVKALRDKTGLSMMDCKKALVEASGDETKALEVLRAMGYGRVTKLAGRETSQGRVACFVDTAAGRGGIVELRCETAPVANTDDFIQLAQLLAKQAAQMDSPTPDSLPKQPLGGGRTVNDAMTEVFNRLRENMQIARVASLRGHVGAYVHHNGQVGVLVSFSGDCPEALKSDVCMHITAMSPSVIRRTEADPAEVDRERAAAAEEAKGKPAAVIDKIVSGKLDRWYAEFVLLEQLFVKDESSKRTVGQVLSSVSPDLTVKQFYRFVVGGS